MSGAFLMSKTIWTFKYEPNSFDDIILNEDLKPKLKKVMTDVPNLMLFGNAGVGKGTFTKVFLEITGIDHMWINASDKTGINYIRDEVFDFATGAGGKRLFEGGEKIKVIVFNEASALSRGPSSAQEILKDLMERTEKICRYFFLVNHINRMTPELKSRCQVLAVDNPPIKEIALFARKILMSENIHYDPKVLATIVKKCYPDIRKTINSIQENSIDGKLVDSKVYSSEEIFNDILKYMLKSDLEAVRKTLRSHYIDYIQLYEFLYDRATEFASPGGAILEIGDHIRWNDTVANQEINFMHMFCKMLWDSVIE